MDTPRKTRASRSLAARLSVYTSLVATVLIMGIAAYAFMLKSDQVIVNEIRQVNQSLTQTSLAVERSMSQVEATVTSNIWQVQKCLTADRPDSIAEVLRQIVAVSPRVSGAGVIFGLGETGGKPYMIYAGSDTASLRQPLPAMAADARNLSYAWLRVPIESGRSGWSGPHAEMTLGREQVCAYMAPVSGGGRTVLLFADVPARSIGDIIGSDMPFFLMQAYVLAPDGQCIASAGSPGESQALTPEEAAQSISALGDSIYEGQHGSFDPVEGDGSRHGDYSTYYNVMNPWGWTLYFRVDFSRFSRSLLRSAGGIISIFALSAIALYALLWYVTRRLTRPLRQFSDSAIEISKGNFTAELPGAGGYDEMARLHDSFATMQQSLSDYTRRLEESTRRQALIMGELQIAGRLQADLLPKQVPPFPERDDVDVLARLIPAKGVGGDLYNYFIRDSRLYFIIGDVSGKSFPAAMVMAMASTAFATVASLTSDPVKIMRELNATTCAHNTHTGFFITALVGVLDLRDGSLELCNAGHDPSLLYTPGSDSAGASVRPLRLTPNLPLGVIAGCQYQGESMVLRPGQRLILYTDGITEAQHAQGRLYGMERLLQVVTGHGTAAAGTLPDEIVESVRGYSGETELTDDLTVMEISYTPSEVALPAPATISASLQSLPAAMEFAEGVCQALGLDSDTAYRVNLAVEETVSNIINNAHGRNVRITLFASVRGGILSVTVSDTGKAFDPCQMPLPDTQAAAADRPVGGLGILLLRQVTTSMSYRRIAHRNHLTLTFDLPHPLTPNPNP